MSRSEQQPALKSKPQTQTQTIRERITQSLVPFVADWIHERGNHRILAEAISKAVIDYKEAFNNRRLAAGQVRSLENDNLLGDFERGVSNVVAGTWQLLFSASCKDRTEVIRLDEITPAMAKEFFVKLDVKCQWPNEDPGSGWQVDGHVANLALFQAGNASLKTKIVDAVLKAIHLNLPEYNLNVDHIREVNNILNILCPGSQSSQVTSVPGLAKDIYHEIRGAISTLENSPGLVSASP